MFMFLLQRELYIFLHYPHLPKIEIIEICCVCHCSITLTPVDDKKISVAFASFLTLEFPSNVCYSV